MSADLIVRNAAIWRHPDATALAVQAGRVVAVGAESDVLSRAGAGTTGGGGGGGRPLPRLPGAPAHPPVGPPPPGVGGGGATLLPGSQAPPAPPPMGGVEMMRCDVSGATSVDAVVAIIRRHVRTLADGAWLLGAGWEFYIMGDR